MLRLYPVSREGGSGGRVAGAWAETAGSAHSSCWCPCGCFCFCRALTGRGHAELTDCASGDGSVACTESVQAVRSSLSWRINFNLPINFSPAALSSQFAVVLWARCLSPLPPFRSLRETCSSLLLTLPGHCTLADAGLKVPFFIAEEGLKVSFFITQEGRELGI